MPGEARLDRDLRGLEVADLTDHHDIRILTQDGAQAAGETHVHARRNLRLRDAIDEIFDGVHDRHDVAARIV